MEKQKLNPLEMVAQEMDGHTSLTPDQIVLRFKSVLDHLKARAAESITLDDQSERALRHAQEYQVVSEMVTHFGSQLIAIEDFNAESGRIPN